MTQINREALKLVLVALDFVVLGWPTTTTTCAEAQTGGSVTGIHPSLADCLLPRLLRKLDVGDVAYATGRPFKGPLQ